MLAHNTTPALPLSEDAMHGHQSMTMQHQNLVNAFDAVHLIVNEVHQRHSQGASADSSCRCRQNDGTC